MYVFTSKYCTNDMANQWITLDLAAVSTPSGFPQYAQYWQGAISQIFEGQGLGFTDQSRKKVWTLFLGSNKIRH